jgi:hypothetical protein
MSQDQQVHTAAEPKASDWLEMYRDELTSKSIYQKFSAVEA